MQFNWNPNNGSTPVATPVVSPTATQSLIFGANGIPLQVETKSEVTPGLPEGTTHIRVLASCSGKNFKAKHEEIKSGQLLVTMQRIIGGGKLEYMDDLEVIHAIPADLLPPHAQSGAYLELGDRVHEIVAQISQDAYLGRGVNGAEPNRSMIFDVLVSSKGEDISINSSGKIQFLRVLEVGNFTKNTGIRKSAEEAFANLAEANSHSADIRSNNRAAAMKNLMSGPTASTPSVSAPITETSVDDDPWTIG